MVVESTVKCAALTLLAKPCNKPCSKPHCYCKRHLDDVESQKEEKNTTVFDAVPIHVWSRHLRLDLANWAAVACTSKSLVRCFRDSVRAVYDPLEKLRYLLERDARLVEANVDANMSVNVNLAGTSVAPHLNLTTRALRHAIGLIHCCRANPIPFHVASSDRAGVWVTNGLKRGGSTLYLLDELDILFAKEMPVPAEVKSLLRREHDARVTVYGDFRAMSHERYDAVRRAMRYPSDYDVAYVMRRLT